VKKSSVNRQKIKEYFEFLKKRNEVIIYIQKVFLDFFVHWTEKRQPKESIWLYTVGGGLFVSFLMGSSTIAISLFGMIFFYYVHT
jgi:Na+/H+ antiporter NhaC